MFIPLLQSALAASNAELFGFLFLHFTAALFLTGAMWFVQVVHYPLFRNIAAIEFDGYFVRHVAGVRWVFLPAMLLEIVTLVVLALGWPSLFSNSLFLVASILLAVLWIWTLLGVKPCYKRLRREGNSRRILTSLVRANWMLTLLWTARSALLWVLLLEKIT